MAYSILIKSIFISTLFNSYVLADENNVTFLFPSTDGLTLNYLDTINITYTSTFPSPKLYTFCINTTNSATITEKVEDVTPFNATWPILLDFQYVSTCYFNLRPDSTVNTGEKTPKVVLLPTQRDGAPQTFGLGQHTNSGTAGIGLSGQSGDSTTADILPVTSSQRTTLSTTSTTSTTPTPPGQFLNSTITKVQRTGGLSKDAQAGISIGVAFGVLLIGTLVFFLVARRIDRIKNETDLLTSNAKSNFYQKTNADSETHQKLPHWKGNLPVELGSRAVERVELESLAVIYEMGSGRRENVLFVPHMEEKF